MKRFLHFAKAILILAPTIIFCYFCWLIKYAKHPEKYPIEERFGRMHKLIKKINKHIGLDTKIVGKENIPDTACCIMSNHVGGVDPMGYFTSIDKPFTFVVKKEVMKYPFVGKCIKALEGAFLDREDLKQSLRVMMSIQEDLKQNKKNWLIFPEGTRNKDPNALCLEFHHGTFRAPMKAGVPIVPAATFGSCRVFKNPGRKHYPIYIEFGKPIYPNEYKDMSTNELASLVQSRVQEMVSYHARKYCQEQIIKTK